MDASLPETIFQSLLGCLRRRYSEGCADVGETGITMERWSLGIAATWYMIMPPLWLYGIDGGVWFCRRSDFQEIGGYDETVLLGEDVEFLRRLKRLGASRRPKQKLATRFTAKKIGIPSAFVLNSSRKWDKHGDWHMFPDVVRGAFYLLFARHRLKDYARLCRSAKTTRFCSGKVPPYLEGRRKEEGRGIFFFPSSHFQE